MWWGISEIKLVSLSVIIILGSWAIIDLYRNHKNCNSLDKDSVKDG